MIPRRPRKSLPNGVLIKKRVLVEGLALMRLLRLQRVSVHDAEAALGIPRREFYRYLQALELAGAPLQRVPLARNRVVYRLPRGWM